MNYLIQTYLGYFKNFYTPKHACFFSCDISRAKQLKSLHIPANQLNATINAINSAYPDMKLTIIPF